MSFFFFFLPCFNFVFLLPNSRITVLLQAHNSWVVVMLCHSEYAYDFIFLLLFFPNLWAFTCRYQSVWNPSVVACFCCTTVSKAVSLPRWDFIHPPNTNKLFCVLMSRPKLSQAPRRLGVRKPKVIGIWRILLPVWFVNSMRPKMVFLNLCFCTYFWDFCLRDPAFHHMVCNPVSRVNKWLQN